MIAAIIITILSISCLVSIGILVHSMYRNHVQEIMYDQLSTKYEQLLDQSPSMPIGDRVDSTNQLLELIDAMISLEIMSTKRFEIFLDKKSKNIDFDNVISEVSTSVFESIKPNVFDDKDNIVSSQYLMSYIQKRTLVQYLTYFRQNMNTGVAQ